MQLDKKMKILVAEDSPRIRKALVSTLKELGFKNIKMAADGHKALEAIKAEHTKLKPEKFDLIFSDIVMPRVNGIELIDAIRQIKDCDNVPIIVISSEKDVDTVLDAAEKGADEYVFKPFVHHEVEDVMRKAIKKRKSL